MAGDVTHFAGRPYLSLIDCGPSRFVIWRRLPNEAADEVCREVEGVFREHSPPYELLLDNAPVFRSQLFRRMCSKWGVNIRYRCAYRASGNGIVERVHRTIKRMAARSNADVLSMVYWYNVSPKMGNLDNSVPAQGHCTYPWRIAFSHADRPPSVPVSGSGFRVGQRVYVKPGSSRCTTAWPEGRITRIDAGGVQLDVDGIPRHVADVRPVPLAPTRVGVAPQKSKEQDDNVEFEINVSKEVDAGGIRPPTPGRRYPTRQRLPPDRYGHPLAY